MNSLFQYIKGDKTIWAVIALMTLFSFLPVYSSSSNLAYLYGNGNTIRFLIKHGAHLLLGVLIIYGVHKVPYHYFKGLSILALPIVVILLIITIAQGTTIAGANASRWIKVPLINLSFQPSSIGWIAIIAYLSWFLWRYEDEYYSFKKSLLYVWFPVFAIVVPIAPSNLF